MPAIYGRHETKQVVTTETFYDSGGPTKNAHPLGIAAVTFTPKYGQAIEVDFSELDLKQATLYVYEGKQELVKSDGGDEDDDEITYTKPNAPPSSMYSEVVISPVISSTPRLLMGR